MEINSQTQSLLQAARTAELASRPRETDAQTPTSNASSTVDTLSISSEAKARLQAEQAADNTMQLQGSGEIIGSRPK